MAFGERFVIYFTKTWIGFGRTNEAWSYIDVEESTAQSGLYQKVSHLCIRTNSDLISLHFVASNLQV